MGIASVFGETIWIKKSEEKTNLYVGEVGIILILSSHKGDQEVGNPPIGHLTTFRYPHQRRWRKNERWCEKQFEKTFQNYTTFLRRKK
jgi:hypothetical protein